MSIDKFRFVSPGVQVAEIDLSRRTRPAAEPGPVIIGRFERGPTMRPTKVDSLNDLEEIFGAAITGRESGDISRNGNFSAPSYAAFAANAWLANQGGATIVRLVGKEAESMGTGGEAGWTVTPATASSGRGGAWGLWVMASGSGKECTGTLGAIFYCEGDTGVILSGTLGGGSGKLQAANCLIKSTDGNLKAIIAKNPGDASSSAGITSDETKQFNFNPQSRNFIRNVFNTTPHNTNSNVVKTTSDSYKRYWLGETFEDRVNKLLSDANQSDAIIAFTAPLVSGSSYYYNHLYDAQSSKTGWVIAQDTSAETGSYSPANAEKLFRFCSLEEGEWTQRNLKISIRNIRLPNSASNADAYGSFDVLVRKMKDNDSAPEAVESYVGVNLNPASPNYIANRIGDQYASWSDTEKRYRYFGAYPNASKYIRVEVASAVAEGSITQNLVPFGFYGPPRPASMTLNGFDSSGDGDNTFIQDASSSAFVADGTILTARQDRLVNSHVNMGTGAGAITASLGWASLKTVQSAAVGYLSDPTDRYFGVDVTRHNSNTLFDDSVYDILKAKNNTLSSDNWDTTGQMENSFIFSLDDVSSSVGGIDANGYVYVSGSRAGGTSYTANNSADALLNAGYDKFTMCLHGASDGLELKEMAPLINNRTGLIGSSAATSYERNTLQRAIDTVADPELVDMNLLVLPGVTNQGVTDLMISTCEQRRDSMAIIDIPNAYTPRHEDNETDESVNNAYSLTGNSVAEAVNQVKRKGYNSSYAATYYPWVQLRAPISGQPTWAPPSVVALGAMGYGEATQAVWFAPAGFTRGGLTEGRGGLPVLAVSQRLSSKDRDKLYEVNINPIAQFPAEGIVIFGQKTLQATPSALDRINVRRLLIFIKKRISVIASTLLFEPNVSATWNRFVGQAVPLLDSIKTGFGLEDFKVVLDQSTTTADLVDRNTMYAKIFVKPTKAVEFIAIDFIITNSGASFDD